MLLDLADGRPREGVAELYDLGHLESGQPLAAPSAFDLLSPFLASPHFEGVSFLRFSE